MLLMLLKKLLLPRRLFLVIASHLRRSNPEKTIWIASLRSQ